MAIATGALLAALAGASHAAPIDPDKLTREMADQVARAAPGVKVEIVGRLTLKLSGGAPKETEVNLDRTADFCSQNSAEDCEASKARFVEGTASMLTAHYKVTRDNLRAVIRSAEYAEGVQGKLKGKKLLIIPFAEGIVVMLAADFPSTTQLVDEGALASVSRDTKTAFEIARKNVLQHLPELPTAAELQKDRIVVIAGQDYTSSILLADGWGDLAQRTNGALLVAVPGDNKAVVGIADTMKFSPAYAPKSLRSIRRPSGPCRLMPIGGERRAGKSRDGLSYSRPPSACRGG